ncbi:MAG: hypothetical protein IOMNBAOH_00576 [Rhodocyclaceae bacterium]|nr:hypothetical protein [Rhodocyclaceae bacterium]
MTCITQRPAAESLSHRTFNDVELSEVARRNAESRMRQAERIAQWLCPTRRKGGGSRSPVTSAQPAQESLARQVKRIIGGPVHH